LPLMVTKIHGFEVEVLLLVGTPYTNYIFS
jgi:hypothetical protein